MNQAITPFVENKRTSIPSLNIEFTEYTHQITGAKHYHFSSDNTENVFMVALRTLPTDSTGVAHILEHTTLCGSEQFPVRDPFFMMIRRSLNTFMNAFTSSDWTAYPFASKNKKDFNNLLRVYLDAVFFPRLDPLDFAQEGHRLEFSDSSNPNSSLEFKGVVFNEMKGAMSSVSSQLWQALGKHIFPNSTYGHNSGGDPVHIPDLSYEQLQAFYQKHYHPSNAVFMTFGDISAEQHQRAIHDYALKRFTQGDLDIRVDPQPRFHQAVKAVERYPIPEGEDSNNKTHVVTAWLLGEIADPYELMRCHLLASILLENSAAPLLKLLETCDFANGPSPLCGLDDSSKEMLFICGIEGANPDAVSTFESHVNEVLRRVAADGVWAERLEALLDQLELQQREISGDSYPYGLQLMLSALPSAMHRHDPAAALDIEPVLKRLRSEIGEPNFVSKLVYDKLLNNQHRVILSLEPDSHLAEQMREQEQARLAEIQSSLTQVEKQAIVDTAKALEERQNQSDDPEVLPTITLDDVPAAIEAPKFVETKQEQRRLRFYPTGTNGLVYMQAFVRLPELSADSIGLLPLHNRLLTELGLGDSDYLSTQDRQSAVCGGIHAFSSFKGAADDVFNLSGYAGLSCKGLAHKADALQALMQDTLQDVRFDELPRIKDIVAQSRARAERSVSGNGHGLAMQIAAQGYSPAAAIAHHSNGIAGIRHLKSIDESLKDSAALNDFAGSLAALHAQLVSPSDVLLVAEQQHENLLESLMTRWDKSNTLSASRLSSKLQQSQSTRELWVANTQVNFCAIAYPTVPPTHRDAAALTVLAGVLRNGFLHTAIREKGGAYGGGASHDSANGIFRFYSYRDPRLGETLDDFRASIAWLLNTDIDDRLVTEAILGVIGSLDKPASPAGTAKEHFRHALFGFTDDMRAAFRSQVLSTTKADLLAVAERYLSQDDFSIGIVTHAGESERYTALAEQNDIRIVNL